MKRPAHNRSLPRPSRPRPRLTDGKLTSVSGAKGCTSIGFPSPDVSANPVWVEVDLGADTVRLFPRTDTPAVGGGTPGFLVDFTIQTRPDGSSTCTTARTVTAEPHPGGSAQTYTLTPATGRYLRLTATKPGKPASDESTRYRLQLAEIRVK
ncbi:discoidin domain-containing protein [Streptomyces sp. B21-097]|uniref:discoidin domain-containing protein n=1 Tax=Streptomyces sp. B21-097 TaxID=3039414 RepID=UPI003FA6C97F